MISEYQNLKKNFKRTLRIFGRKLLFYSVLKGGIRIGITILFFLLFHDFCNHYFQLSVIWKTFYFYFFLLVLFLEVFFFFVYPLFRFLFYSRWENNFLLNDVSKYYTSDVFFSIYHLAFHSRQIPGDEILKKAAFVQKYNDLISNKSLLIFPHKILYHSIFVLFLIVSIFFFYRISFESIFRDMSDYKTVYFKDNFSFLLLNNHLNVEYGQSLELKLLVKNKDYENNHVFICFNGNEFLMNRRDSIFVYNFESINNDIQFNFKISDKQSDFYKITVLPTPILVSYEATITPPSYTGLKSDTYSNLVDFQALYGSSLKIEFFLSNVDSLYLKNEDSFMPIDIKNDMAVLDLNIFKSKEYSLIASNKFISKKNLLDFTVTSVADLYPGIQLIETQDSLNISLRHFYGVITDDYGFSKLCFNYSLNGETYTVVPLSYSENSNVQEFYFSYDFSKFQEIDFSEINFFFQVFDNDILSGPKSASSIQKVYKIPDLNAIFNSNLEMNHAVHSELEKAKLLTREILSEIKNLQKKMLDDNVDPWEKRQLSKEIIKKKENLDGLLTSVKENNVKKLNLNSTFLGRDTVLLNKQKQLQDLLNKIVDDRMKDLMDEFSKLSEEFSKDKFHDLDEKMKFTFKQVNQELDRHIELFKRYQIEEQHQLITKRFEKLKSDQFDLEMKQRSHGMIQDSFSMKAFELHKNLDSIRNNYMNLFQQNKELLEPYKLSDFEKDFQQLSKDLNKQHNQSFDQRLSEQLRKEMDELMDKLKAQQEQNFADNSLPKKDVELIIQNILLISLSQEDLLNQFSDVEVQSSKYNELGKYQDLKRQEYKIVKDSLLVLAKSNLMLASLLNHKFQDIEMKFDLLPDYIQNNRRGNLLQEQQYIINFLNDIALSLMTALQNEQNNSHNEKVEENQDLKSNKNNGGKKGNYNEIKSLQNVLKQQLEELISKMKTLEKGEPLYKEISNMIRQNELFKKNLNEMISESDFLSVDEKQLLNEINKLLDDNIRDLSNHSISRHLINRNNVINNKLLIFEKAFKEREEFEEKRISKTASDIRYERPNAKINSEKRSGLMKIDLQKANLKLNNYFEKIYNDYYIKLGHE